MHTKRVVGLTFLGGSRLVSLALLLSLFLVAPVVAFQTPDDNSRKIAFDLYRQGKAAEALPLFEKVVAANPSDKEATEALGFVLLSQAIYSKDPEVRKTSRARGRQLLIRAKEMGAASPLLDSTLATLAATGGADTSFSADKEVDDAMREGEAAFAKGEYAKAIDSYQHALLFDPKHYEAAVFIGDGYFALGQPKTAGEWYAKAIEIDPNRETAYRYWGDVLMKQGQMVEARDKFVEAYIREPYYRLTQAAFVDWGRRNNIEIAHPLVKIPTSVSRQEGNTTITIDPNALKNDKDPAASAWLLYGMVRAGWVNTNFAKEYPNEKKYRHSLKEEAEALRAVVAALPKKETDRKKLESSLQTLLKLESDGLLEAYVLLAMPDAGIAQDFLAYRQTNIDKLRRYVFSYILPSAQN